MSQIHAQLCVLTLALLVLGCGADPTPRLEGPGVPSAGTRLLAGTGDRLELHGFGRKVSMPDEARRLGLPTDLFAIWLPRGWQEAWIPKAKLRALIDTGTLPVVIHYFFPTGISRERVEAQRRAWHASLRRAARAVSIDAPVLLVLEPEFNDDPPPGEQPIISWPGFGAELRRAIEIVRDEAPLARVGVCAGDFWPDRELETPLGEVAGSLDFIAFQEMRAGSRASGDRDAYLALGNSATRYARYLRGAFDLPILLAYVAVSSHDGWEDAQARAIESLHAQREELREAGVFGLIYFQLRDEPGKTGYFGTAEGSFGLIDHRGRPKPALEVFRRFRRR